MKLIFFLGVDIESRNKKIQRPVLNEQNKFGDLVVEDFIDSYVNLTLKSLFILKWAKDYCPQAKFVAKVEILD